MKILVADDSKTNLTIISKALEKLGHITILAKSGEEAVQYFQKEHPDLIILDVVMEGIGGFECARQIRNLDAEEWIPIIFLSASVDDESIAKGIDAGGDDYLTKPFSEITLAAKIKAMQRIADMRAKLFETTKKLYLLSSTDVLTGVYNRLQFDRSLKEGFAEADRFNHKIALLFLDLDNFKSINDTFGHHIGDQLLIEVTKRLRTCLRENDFIARLGGDEFAIILKRINNISEAESVAVKIIQRLSEDYFLEKNHIRSSASVGIALYPDELTNKKNIVLNADFAMYYAKSTGRNNFKFFTKKLYQKYKQHLHLEEAIKFAQEKEELFLTYQPVFQLKTKKLIGVEVILSWNHPKYGLIPPNIFFPIAEESGLMPKIGVWGFKKMCEETSDWPLKLFDHFIFSVNIFSSQLDNKFISELHDLIRYTHINSNHLELELSESLVMSHTSTFAEIIQTISNMGIKLSIKDFGTGHSSLVRLKKLAINTIKIEESFVKDALLDQNSEVIVNTLIFLGRKLNLNVIAEGIQTEDQLNYLISNDCPEGQGSLLCQPLKHEAMRKYLEQSRER